MMAYCAFLHQNLLACWQVLFKIVYSSLLQIRGISSSFIGYIAILLLGISLNSIKSDTLCHHRCIWYQRVSCVVWPKKQSCLHHDVDEQSSELKSEGELSMSLGKRDKKVFQYRVSRLKNLKNLKCMLCLIVGGKS